MAPKSNALKKAPIDFTVRRQHQRHPTAPSTTALIDPNKDSKKFVPEMAALLLNESAKGCALVLRHTEQLAVGDICSVKLGTLAPFYAEVRWRTVLDAETIKIGVMFLDGENPVRR